MEVKVISDWGALTEHFPAWEELADAALEPNPFYEHWMLLPALRHFGPNRNLQVALVFDNSRGSRLCGVFPLARLRPYQGLPVSALSFWKYNHCPLAVPLIRNGVAREVLAALFEWLRSGEARCDVLDMQYVPGDGTFHQLLVDQLHAAGITPIVWEWFTRALFRPMETAERYFTAALSGKHRKALRRRTEMLSEMGALEFTVAQPEEDISRLIDSFLKIESSGWKGREGSAMACREANRNFFTEAVTAAFRKDRLLMTSLRVGGRTIAQNCYFRAGRGSFHFKPAFDEEFARFSPGFHMECELIRHLHSRPEIEWMDSCTSADNEMYNRLFVGRRTMQSLLVPLRGGVGGVLVSTLPFLRSLKKAARSLWSGASANGAGKGKAAGQESGAVREPDRAGGGEG